MIHREKFKLTLLMIITVVWMAGCGTTPRERRGVSHIPINTPGPPETRGIDGSL